MAVGVGTAVGVAVGSKVGVGVGSGVGERVDVSTTIGAGDGSGIGVVWAVHAAATMPRRASRIPQARSFTRLLLPMTAAGHPPGAALVHGNVVPGCYRPNRLVDTTTEVWYKSVQLSALPSEQIM